VSAGTYAAALELIRASDQVRTLALVGRVQLSDAFRVQSARARWEGAAEPRPMRRPYRQVSR
jgi:hypothetical protein